MRRPHGPAGPSVSETELLGGCLGRARPGNCPVNDHDRGRDRHQLRSLLFLKILLLKGDFYFTRQSEYTCTFRWTRHTHGGVWPGTPCRFPRKRPRRGAPSQRPSARRGPGSRVRGRAAAPLAQGPQERSRHLITRGWEDRGGDLWRSSRRAKPSGAWGSTWEARGVTAPGAGSTCRVTPVISSSESCFERACRPAGTLAALGECAVRTAGCPGRAGVEFLGLPLCRLPRPTRVPRDGDGPRERSVGRHQALRGTAVNFWDCRRAWPSPLNTLR